MKEPLCGTCSETFNCRIPLPMDECENYKPKHTNEEIIRLFRGMSKTMQESIIQIMEVTQIK